MSSKTPAFDKSLPHSPDAERAVLGAILIRNECLFRIGNLSADHFHKDENRIIFQTIALMREEHDQNIEPLTLKEALIRRGLLDLAGGVAYISSLLDMVPDVANVERYAKIVERAAKKRANIAIGNKLIRSEFESDPETEPEDNAAAAMASLGSVATREEAQARPLAEVLRDAFERQERLATEGRSVALDVGWSTLNSHKVFHPTFIVCTADRGCGKTALMVDWSRRLAQNGHPNVIFTLESTGHEIGLRYASMDTSIPHSWMRDWRPPVWTDTHRARSMQCLREAGELGVHVVRGMRSVEEILLEIRRLKMMHGIQAAFVDYIQLIGTRQRFERHELSLAHISQSFLASAIDNEVVVCAFSQVNKDGGVAYADSIEKSARVRIHFDRPYADDRAKKCKIEMSIVKNNEERTGSLHAHFNESTQQWTEVSDRWETSDMWSVACEEAGHIRTERKLFA
jgi:replicative DNA helicase